ncbi:DUF2239 family protein [Telmatospirillum sp.]|uniref:DUF2239 family protein n=1 Tax=Telmatospirillum sp. TaxID=2079197 RepID=UPI002842B868|nr:DUF2239 family protein [Telmatospirillum sp.]MDR3440699.1 DUF2239 family protein [Telmatospirillum sp.]
MNDLLSKPCSAFAGDKLLSSGPLIEVALAVKNAEAHGNPSPILIFDDSTGQALDFDLRGTKADIIARLSQPTVDNARQVHPREGRASGSIEHSASEPRGRGRPKLGVVAREVTLLPRHWEWLATQPGGASVTLRKLVDEARRTNGTRQKMRAAQEAAYRVMSALAGNLPGFEEATRALFANDRPRFEQQIAAWPGDFRCYATRLGFLDDQPDEPGRMTLGFAP